MILELSNICLSFTRNSEEPFKILDRVNLTVHKGKVTALIGGNGAGKTTLFNIISGFQTGFTGEIYLNSKSISDLKPYQIARAGIGRLFQDKQLMPDLTLLENMKIGSNDHSGELPFAYLFQKKKINKMEAEKEEKAINILNKLFGKKNKYVSMLHHKASNLSYGEQRLIGLARLLMGDYTVLLLDEPTAGVNIVYLDIIKDTILKMIKEEQLSILLIEHNINFVSKCADYCAFLNEGVIHYQGTSNEVLNNHEIRNSYLGI